MAVSLSSKQRWSINHSDARQNIWEGSVRASKTWASIFRWIQYVATAPKGDLLMTGKTGKSLYRNVIRPMEDFLGRNMKYFPGKGEVELFGRKIFVIGANDERSEGIIRGMTCAGAYGDEITLWPESYYQMMLSRMSVAKAQFFGTTNTDGPYHWFKKKFLDRRDALNMRVFHFTIDDNPFLDPQYVQDLKNEYTGLWYKRFIEALWVLAEGTIYDFFDEDEHCIIKPPSPMFKVVGIDYGTGNPTTFIKYGVNYNTRPKIWADEEYYFDSTAEGYQKTDSDYADDFEKFVKDDKISLIIYDPSAKSFAAELLKRGFPQLEKAENDVLDGIRVQGRMLKTGLYAIRHKRCPKTVEEYGAYVWDSKQQMKGQDVPMKTADHTKDNERYVLLTLFGPEIIDYYAFTKS